jgi:hypothetical protein
MIRNFNDKFKHGDFGMYTYGKCRCAPCTAANTKHTREWRARKRYIQANANTKQAIIDRAAANTGTKVPTQRTRKPLNNTAGGAG